MAQPVLGSASPTRTGWHVPALTLSAGLQPCSASMPPGYRCSPPGGNGFGGGQLWSEPVGCTRPIPEAHDHPAPATAQSPETGAADHVRWFLRRFRQANEQELRREVSRERSLAANLNTSSTDQVEARRLGERAHNEREQEARDT